MWLGEKIALHFHNHIKALQTLYEKKYKDFESQNR